MLSKSRVIHPFLRPLALPLLTSSLLLLGCGSDDPPVPAATLSSVARPDKVEWNGAFRADATVIAPEIVAKLENPSAHDGVYRFDASAGDAIAGLPPGRAVVLSGVDVVRVKSVKTEGSAIVLVTEPANLPDVVENAKASWDVGIDYQTPAPGSLTPSALSEGGGFRFLAAPASVSKLSYKGPVGIFDVTGDFLTTDDSLRFTGLVSMKSGNAIMKVALDGTMKRFRHRGDLSIRNGKVEGFWFEVDDLDVVLDMNLGGVALGKGNEAFAIPIEIVVPMALGPIPTFFSVGARLEVNPSLGETSSSRGKAHFVVKGSAGLTWSPAGGFVTTGSLAGSDVQFTDYEGVSTLNCGLGILAHYPIVKFGVGLDVAGASIYMSHKAEVVTNMTMRYEAAGPYPVITGNCFEANLNHGAFVGGEARLAGLKLAKEQAVWTKVRPLVKEGNACK